MPFFIMPLPLQLLCVCFLFWEGVLSGESPRLIPLFFPTDLEAGRTARSTCTASTGQLPIEFRWMKDGEPFSKELLPYELKQLDPYTSTLMLGPLHENHVGNYTCVVSNSDGSDSSTASLVIKIAPRWVEEPFNVSVEEHDSIMIPCFGIGSPKPQVDWTKSDGHRQSFEQRWKVGINGSLSIPHSQKQDAGLYTCRVHNGVGESLSKTIMITVWVRPRITKKYLSESVEKGKDITLPCEAEGDQPLSFSWSKDRRNLNEPGSSQHRFSQNIIEGGAVSLMHIYNADPRDAGVYMCTTKNEAGQDSMSIRLTVTEKPSMPLDVEISDLWSRNVRIRWTTPVSGSTSILQYTLEHWEVNDPDGDHKNVSVPGALNYWIVDHLRPATTYRLRLWASNNVGISPPSTQIQFTTSQEEPSAPPEDIKVESFGATFVRLSWKPPPWREWNGPLQGFYVGYKTPYSNSAYSFYTAPFTNTSNHVVLRGLQRSSSYEVVVKAFNAAGTGPASKPLMVTTNHGEAPPRPMLSILTVGSTSLQFKGAVMSEDFHITGYKLYYRGDQGEWQDLFVPRSDENKFTLGNLEAGKLYQVYLVAQGSFGDSEPSEMVSIRTAAAVPHTPSSTGGNANRVGSSEEDLVLTQTLYIVIPIVVATVIIVTIVVGACLYVYYKRPLHLPLTPYPGRSIQEEKPGSLMFSAGRSTQDNMMTMVPPSGLDIQKDQLMPYPSSTLRHHTLVKEPPLMAHTPGQRRAFDTLDLDAHWSTAPTLKTNDSSTLDEEPIYESVIDEMRTIMKQRNHNNSMRKPSHEIYC